MITGPQSPGVKSQMILSCEQHVDWIADCLAHLRDRGLHRIEPERAAEDAWVQHTNEVADGTLYPLANSWYTGANIPGQAPRVHALRRRRDGLQEEMRRGCSQGLRGLCIGGVKPLGSRR